MATVWVVMGNDYPDSVWTSEEAANARIAREKAEDLKKWPQLAGQGLFWRVFEFEVQS
jgi:hypothetical protein